MIPNAQPDFNYVVYAVAPNNIWSLSYFTVSTTSAFANFCGSLIYSVDGGAIDSSLTYYSGSHELEIYSADRSLIANSPYTYTVSAQFSNFPGLVIAQSTGQIILLDPCDDPFTLQAAVTLQTQ